MIGGDALPPRTKGTTPAMMTESSRTIDRVAVTVSVHGPLRRISLLPLDPPEGAQVSVFRIGDALIDTGSTRVTAALLEVLAEAPPARVFLTHQHEDHIGNLGPILARFGAMPVLAPRALVDTIVALRKVPPYRAAYWGDPHPVERAWLTPYDPGDELAAGEHRVLAMATPGHTPPHVAFVVRDAGITYALTGDLYASRPLDGFYEAAIDDAIRSYRAVADLADEVVMLPTHGKVRTHGSQVLRSGAEQLEREVASIQAKARELGTRDPRVVAEALYGPDPALRVSAGEMGKAIFVRAVLDPARALPVQPIALAVAQPSGTDGST